jgi:hypothetical protein
MVALFKHFGEVSPATNPGVDGDIQIGNHEDGWLWAIPIRTDKLSVGAVMSPDCASGAASLEAAFDDHVGRVGRIRRRLEGAVPLTELKVESDFCYHTEALAGQGFFVTGDAGCFVDPIFSAGVFLATTTGWQAAETTSLLLRGEISEAEASDLYSRFYKTGYDCYFRLIYAFYENHFKLYQLLKNTGGFVDPIWVTQLLNGDFWSDGNALAQHLRRVRRYDTFAPFEPLFGCPIYPDLDSSEPKGVPLHLAHARRLGGSRSTRGVPAG